MTPDALRLISSYSSGAASAVDVRRALGDVTFGDLLMLLGEAGLCLPASPVEGREADLARAREWMFPAHDLAA